MFFETVKVKPEAESEAAKVSSDIEKHSGAVDKDKMAIRKIKDDKMTRFAERSIGLGAEEQSGEISEKGSQSALLNSQFAEEFQKNVHKGLEQSEVEYSDAAKKLMEQM
jgi:hypothetical protein